jgi:hypothetical protein
MDIGFEEVNRWHRERGFLSLVATILLLEEMVSLKMAELQMQSELTVVEKIITV